MYVILNAAMSADGKIATRSGNSSISSIVDLKRVHRLRTTVDAIMIGIQTVLTDNPMLDVRFAKTKKKKPLTPPSPNNVATKRITRIIKFG